MSLMMVEKVPDSTYEMVGGLDKQIQEIKEVCMHMYVCMYACMCLRMYACVITNYFIICHSRLSIALFSRFLPYF